MSVESNQMNTITQTKTVDKLIAPYFREMFELFNVNDQKGLTVFEIENGVVDMTQTGDMFDRWAGRKSTFRL